MRAIYDHHREELLRKELDEEFRRGNGIQPASPIIGGTDLDPAYPDRVEEFVDTEPSGSD